MSRHTPEQRPRAVERLEAGLAPQDATAAFNCHNLTVYRLLSRFVTGLSREALTLPKHPATHTYLSDFRPPNRKPQVGNPCFRKTDMSKHKRWRTRIHHPGGFGRVIMSDIELLSCC
ncbi:hypothetical protein ScPMuIL_000954 [Solemya velum]